MYPSSPPLSTDIPPSPTVPTEHIEGPQAPNKHHKTDYYILTPLRPSFPPPKELLSPPPGGFSEEFLKRFPPQRHSLKSPPKHCQIEFKRSEITQEDCKLISGSGMSERKTADYMGTSREIIRNIRKSAKEARHLRLHGRPRTFDETASKEFIKYVESQNLLRTSVPVGDLSALVKGFADEAKGRRGQKNENSSEISSKTLGRILRRYCIATPGAQVTSNTRIIASNSIRNFISVGVMHQTFGNPNELSHHVISNMDATQFELKFSKKGKKCLSFVNSSKIRFY
jgi:hypothetical protein